MKIKIYDFILILNTHLYHKLDQRRIKRTLKKSKSLIQSSFCFNKIDSLKPNWLYELIIETNNKVPQKKIFAYFIKLY